jgi:hypothetical protein
VGVIVDVIILCDEVFVAVLLIVKVSTGYKCRTELGCSATCCGSSSGCSAAHCSGSPCLLLGVELNLAVEDEVVLVSVVVVGDDKFIELFALLTGINIFDRIYKKLL